MPIAVNLSARYMACGLAFFEGEEKNRVIFYHKALSLREDLGIVSENGNFCSWDSEEDNEINGEGQFVELQRSVFANLLVFIALFNRRLPLNSEARIPYHYPPSELTIMNHLLSNAVNIEFPDNDFNENLANIIQRREYFSQFFLGA